MALLKCFECNHDVSEYADKCPNCGCPVEIIKQHLDNSIEDKDKKMYTIINGEKKEVSYYVKMVLEHWDTLYENTDIGGEEFNHKIMKELDIPLSKPSIPPLPEIPPVINLPIDINDKINEQSIVGLDYFW